MRKTGNTTRMLVAMLDRCGPEAPDLGVMCAREDHRRILIGHVIHLASIRGWAAESSQRNQLHISDSRDVLLGRVRFYTNAENLTGQHAEFGSQNMYHDHYALDEYFHDSMRRIARERERRAQEKRKQKP